jgi:hypothetical protein
LIIKTFKEIKMTDFAIIGDKKYIKIASPDGWCGGCAFTGSCCTFPTDDKGYSDSQCSNPSVIYREYKEPEQSSLTKAEVIAAIYSETPIECSSTSNPVNKQSYFTPDFLSDQSLGLDQKVITYLQHFNRGLMWRYKKVPKVLSVTTRKFLQRDSDDAVLINIWSSHWETPQEEIPIIIKSFIRWLEEPQTTTHEI